MKFAMKNVFTGSLQLPVEMKSCKGDAEWLVSFFCERKKELFISLSQSYNVDSLLFEIFLVLKWAHKHSDQINMADSVHVLK